MVMQREYTGVYPGSGKEGPTSSGEREYCISLHRSACIGVTSCERGSWSQVSEEKNEELLEMLILKPSVSLSSPRDFFTLLFYRLKRRV
jgi:hypothetical protein